MRTNKMISKLKKNNFQILLGSYLFSIFAFGSNSQKTFIPNSLFIILFAFQLKKIIIERKISVNPYFFALFPFLASLLIGVFYAFDQSYALGLVKTYFNLVILFYIIVDNSDSNCLLEKNIDTIFVSAIIFTFYVLKYYSIKEVLNSIYFSKRLGYEISQPNSIGYIVSIGFIITFYKIKYQNIIGKLVLISVLFLQILLIFATQSRKAMMMSFIGVGLLLLIENWKKISTESLKRLILSLIIILFAYRFMLIFPSLDKFNSRIKSMKSLLFNKGVESNSSDLVRKLLIKDGYNLFKFRPMTGHGTGSFRYINSLTNIFGQAASHNNFIELLVNNGLIGFILYYCPITITLFDMKTINKDMKDSVGIIIFVIFFTDIFINGMTAYTYYDKISYIFYALSCAYVLNNRNTLYQMRRKK